MRLLASRTLSLRAPILNEEERAHFQRRLALTALVVFALALAFWLVLNASVLAFSSSPTRLLGTWSSKVELLTTLFAAVIWLAMRRGKRSTVMLDVVDAASLFGICLGWMLMIANGAPRGMRPELIALLACSYTLVVRAALVPSTPARTLVLGIVSMAPIVPVTSSLYKVPPPEFQLSPTFYATLWATVGIATTVVISYVIYGLSLQVRQAKKLGQYVLEEKIGEGGMGVVYRASHAMLRRATAIKLLTGKTGHSAERFEREVQMTARLTHPNTVAVFDYGRTPDGVFYYAMEYLEGITLEDLIADHGPQPPRRVAHILAQICGALEEAHANGLVHRDIKPANVMLTRRGGLHDVVKVLDFGLVKETEAGASALALSTRDAVLGTPHYMAPEAIIDPQNVDGRADIYAVGATAYFLLTGERVFDGSNLVEICSQHLHQAPAPPSRKREEVPDSLERVVLACLEKKRDDRPRDAGVLAEMLAGCGLHWTRLDAKEWWATHGPDGSGAQPKSRARKRSEGAKVYGETVTVALDDRASI